MAGTSDWTAIGTTPSTDQWLSQYGGVYFALESASDQYLTDLTQVLFGSVTLHDGGAANTVFYDEFVAGTGSFQATSLSLGQITYGPTTVPTGHFTATRAKFASAISSVSPLLPNVTARVVESGAAITISGSGFGQQCSTCQVLAVPAGSSLGYPLQISSWSDQTITASLPGSYSGFVRLFVQTASGQDEINIMTAPAPAISVPAQKIQFAYTIGDSVPPAQSIQLTNSGGGTLSWSATWSAPWVSVTPTTGTAPSTLTVLVKPTGLAVGTYTDTVQISAEGAFNSPVAVSTTLTVAAAVPTPTITISAVVNGASFLPGIASATWITIEGSGLSSTTRIWNKADFNGNQLPIQLDGVSVTVNGKPANVYYISPTQLNVLAPDDPITGPVPVQVTTSQGQSNIALANKGIVSPALFLFTPNYPAAIHANGSYLGKPGLITGASTTPAKPGETILLFGTGFGPTNPPLPSGQIVSQAARLASSVSIFVGGKQANVSFAGLGASGEDQFNVTVPADLPDGDQPLLASVNGLQTQANVFITVLK